MIRLFFSEENVLRLMARYADGPTLQFDLPALAGCPDLSPIWKRVTEDNDTWRAVLRNTYRYLTKEERERAEKEPNQVLLARQNLEKLQPQFIRTLNLENPLSQMNPYFSPKIVGNYLLGQDIPVGRPKSIKLWNLETGEYIGSFREKTSAIRTALKVHQNFLFVISSEDNCIEKWKIDSLELEGKFIGHTQAVTVFKIAQNLLFSGSRDNSIRQWNIETLQCLRVYFGHTGAISALKVAGKHLFSASYDTTAKMWDTEAGKYLLTFKGHARSLSAIKVFEGSLFTGEFCLNHSCVREWDIRFGVCIRVFGEIYSGGVMPADSIKSSTIVKIAIAGDRLITSSVRKTIIWDRNKANVVFVYPIPLKFIKIVGSLMCATTTYDCVAVFDAKSGDLLKYTHLTSFFRRFHPAYELNYILYSKGRLVVTNGIKVKMFDFNPQAEALTLWQKIKSFII